MPAADASTVREPLALRSPVVAEQKPLSRPRKLANVNVVHPLAHVPPADPRTALDPKFSYALDLKLRRLKEKQVLEGDPHRKSRPRSTMVVLTASECNIARASLQDRAQREKSYRSHPQLNGIESREKTKMSPCVDESPSPELKGHHRQGDMEKPRFVTTVKTGQFLLPPPQVAYLLGLHTLYPQQEREKIVYSYSSKPKAVAMRSKHSLRERKEEKIPNGGAHATPCQKRVDTREAFRGVRALVASVAGVRSALEEHDRLGEMGARKPMLDRRVVRGSTFAQHPAHAHAHPAGDGASKARRRALARRAALARLRPGTPPPPPGRNHLPVQTDHYLQELFDKGVEMEVGVQTELFADRPATPLYVPAKTGADAHTQIYPGDLFDFDLEVQPILEVLVGKTAEQALAEVAHEEELAALREQQRRYREMRDAERAERQRLLAHDLRLRAEKEARVGEARAGAVAAQEARGAAAAATLVQGYVAALLPSVLAGLRDHGYLLERVHAGVKEEVMPWLIKEVSAELESIITSRDVITEIVREVMTARAQAPPHAAPATPSPPSTPSDEEMHEGMEE